MRRRVRRRTRPEDTARSFEALRQVMVGPERTRLERLEERPELGPETLGPMLPEVVAQATKEREQALAIALEPTVTSAVTVVARRHPEFYGELLAPAIGAAVRKAVAEALAAMLERFNEALERSLSIRSVAWRIEAARTGRPFAEVVLFHTLVYRVEQVFLIHTTTSLVLKHLVDRSLGAKAPDQVAAMLSAIDSFGRDAFGPLPPEDHLRKFEIGDLVVWVSRDPLVTLAVVVRGTPASDLGEQLNEALTRVRLSCQSELLDFSGDVSRFDAAEPVLEPLLRIERRPPPSRAHLVLIALAVLIVVGSGGLLWRRHVRQSAEAQRQAAYVAALSSEPGIVVSQARFGQGEPRVLGLRDPLSAPPEAVLQRSGLAPIALELVPFVSLDPRIVERRAQHALEPPPTVRMTISDGALRVSGGAPRDWMNGARLVARTLPGVERYDESELRPQEALDGLRSSAAELGGVEIRFGVGKWSIGPEQEREITRAAELARKAFGAADEARFGACLELLGHADPHGAEEENGALSQKRSLTVQERLASLGVDPARTRAIGAGVWQVGGQRARSVTFRLRVDESGPRAGCGGAP